MRRILFLISFFLIFFFFSSSALASHCAKQNATCNQSSDCQDATDGCSGFTCKEIYDQNQVRTGGVCTGPAPAPASPTELRVVGAGSDYIEVQWKNTEHVDHYEISYGKTGETSLSGKRQPPSGQALSSTVISGLAPETSYTLSAKACNSTGGCSVSSNQTQAKTLSSAGACGREGAICGSQGGGCCNEFRCERTGDQTSGRCTFFIGDNDNPLREPPQNFRAVKVTARTAELVWKILPFAQRYEIEYETKRGEQKKTSPVPPATIDGLEPKTEYPVFIKGCNRAGCSPRSLISLTTTEEKRSPLAPTTPTPTPPIPPCAQWADKTGREISKEEAFETPERKCLRIDTGLGFPIPTDPLGFVKTLFGIVLSLSGGIALLLIITSGYQLMTSQGNPEKVQAAKETITSAIAGLLFIIFSLAILQIIGVDILRIPGFGR